MANMDRPANGAGSERTRHQDCDASSRGSPEATLELGLQAELDMNCC